MFLILICFAFGPVSVYSEEVPVGKIGSEVVDMVSFTGEAAVIIALKEPMSLEGGWEKLLAADGLEHLKAEIVAIQEEVLSALGPGDFTLMYRYRTVSGMAGTIRQTALMILEGHPGVMSVTIDREIQALLAESVPLINADDVHDLCYTGAGIAVGVLDTGIDTDHPDLSDDITGQKCFGTCPGGQDSAEDDEGHGTHVAGIITSRGTIAPLGVAPDTEIVAVKVLDSDGQGNLSDLIAGLDWINYERRDVKVVNMSLGTLTLFTGMCDSFEPLLSDAINALNDRGTVLFAASGNSASSTGISMPACMENAHAIGAVYDADVGPKSWGVCSDFATEADRIACFSNSNRLVDVLAPGSMTTSTRMGGGKVTMSGTSMATPHAAAVAALMLDKDETLSPDAIISGMQLTGISIRDKRNSLTFSRVDAYGAVGHEPPSFALDDFLCYRATTTKGTPKFEPLEVSLADQFEDKFFDVKKPVSLCNPASKDGGEIIDPDTHLKGYKIKKSKGEVKHERQTGIKVINRFGELFVDTIKPDRLLVPTAKSLTKPVDPPDPEAHDVDHYKCYNVKISKGTDKFPKGIRVSIKDQFGQPKLYDVKRPSRLCIPVDKNGEGIKDPDTHLMCYKVKPARGEPRHEKVTGIFTNNQFGPEQLDTEKEEELCVPSMKFLISE
jgi:hypothetical protein